MESQATRYGHVIRLDKGEEVIASLTAFAAERGLRAGLISGLGAMGEVELGFFVPTTHEYIRQSFPGDYEIGMLTGNYSELNGRPFPHCHAIIGAPDFTAYTGHLFRGVVTVTCEIQVVTDPGVILRAERPDLGFNPLRLGG